MPSATRSSEWKRGWFSPALFRKNVARFWPIWAGYAAVTFFFLPMALINEGRGDRPAAYLAERAANVTQNAAIASVCLGAFFGLLAAMALFSYLMDQRSVQMFHSLPIRREGLFFTNWLSGLWFFLVPNLVLFVITLAVEGVYGALAPADLAMWLLTATAAPMFFFCFAVCCAMFTGHILALPVFYGILNFLVAGVCALLDGTGDILLYNYGGSTLSGSAFARWCTPLWHLIDQLDASSRLDGTAVTIVVCYCVALGAAFTSIAAIVYRLRELERAGDIVTVAWVRPVFQYGLGVCVGLLLGLVLYANFFTDLGPAAYILTTAVCAVLGAFAGRMLLKKTLRVFAEGWKGPAALGVVLALLMAGVYADFFGYQSRVPDPAQVESVCLISFNDRPLDDACYANIDISDPELIARVTDFHRTLNGHLDELRELDRRGGAFNTYDETESQTRGSTWIRLTYTLSDGSTLARLYDCVPIRAEDLTDSGSYAAKMTALLNDPAVLTKRYGRWLSDGDAALADMTASGGYISGTADLVRTAEGYYHYLDGVETARAEPVYFGDELTLSSGEAQTIWEAFQKDLEEGNVKRYLLDDEERNANCYISDIHLSLTWMETNERTGERETQAADLTFTPEKSEEHVMEALEQLGLKDFLLERGSGADGDD